MKGLRIARLIFGLFLFALGSVFVMKGNLGFGPWEVFQAGLTHWMPLTIGQATVLVSVVIVLLIMLLKEKIGIGTLANMALIGLFMDFILWTNLLPKANGLPGSLGFVVLGLFTTALGSYFYIGSGFGAGPRDSLMVSIRRRTGLPIGVCRSSLECSIAVIGWLLGGPLGPGTVITAFGLGLFVQLVFRMFAFEITAVNHENLRETFKV
ncbi:YczE/YyaS/YitT family protein [Fictibacillus enclensis]|uniref:YczE/YyaS/YitT family protein n=1 Tax=Fictibacillus enclensis TaxID=1017270 RepID=UPI0024BFC504|nr:hypothetical protein [Fictibacillus enclensis]WHY73800.1 hypothetical protein QNH15_07780 [Fictibacillus enclensis]